MLYSTVVSISCSWIGFDGINVIEIAIQQRLATDSMTIRINCFWHEWTLELLISLSLNLDSSGLQIAYPRIKSHGVLAHIRSFAKSFILGL